MRPQRAHLFSSGTSNVGSRRMRLYGRGVPREWPGGCRDGTPVPSASTLGNIDCNPDSGHPPEALAADGTGVPSLHRPATRCPPQPNGIFLCVLPIDFNKIQLLPIFFSEKIC